MTTNFKLPHCVDDANGVVYVSVRSFLGAMAASIVGKQTYPDYKIELVSEDRFTELSKDYERIN